MTPLEATLRRLDRPPRIASLIVTIWGDAVVPRGGSLWLGTLQTILGQFGCREGQVRTAMSRLTEEGWLLRTRQGRLSFYRLGPRGEASFAAAARRIYDPPRADLPPWDGAFRLLLSADPALQATLAPRGFVPLGAGFLFGTDGTAEDLPGSVPLLFARARDMAEAAGIAARAWPALAPLAEGYRGFTDRFFPLAALAGAVPGAEILPLRLLLVHEYRRLALRDPALPPGLLPPAWPGVAARALAARLYRQFLPASEDWLSAHGRAEAGPLPPADPRQLAARFRDG